MTQFQNFNIKINTPLILLTPFFKYLNPLNSLKLISLHNLHWIFTQICISHHGWEKFFKFLVFRLLENAFTTQKIESKHFYSCLPCKHFPQVFIITTQAEGNYSSPTTTLFRKSISSSRKGEDLKETQVRNGLTRPDFYRKKLR